MRKEIRIMILFGYGTLHAMRRHKAWRGGYPKRSRAAYPPPRLVVSYIDTELDHKLRKNNREQVIKIFLWPGVRKYWFVVA